MLELNQYEWISFDCYGTLIDWETGISNAVSEVLRSHGIRICRPEILTLFADAEPKVQQSSGYLKYREVLHRVMAIIGTQLGVQLTQRDVACLANSLPDWPFFPDVVDALKTLKNRYKLAVISNVDDDLFASTAEKLGVDFDAVVTAEQVRSYKPDLRNFRAAAERMAVDEDYWLHIAESLYHDIGPANQLGITSVWVNRTNRGGGTRRTNAIPDLVIPDLATLARMVDTP